MDTPLNKITLPAAEKIEFREVQTIIHCEGEENYTHSHFTDGSRVIISRSLIEFEGIIEGHRFIRTYKTYLANKMHTWSFHKTDGCSLTMHNGKSVPVSRRRKDFI